MAKFRQQITQKQETLKEQIQVLGHLELLQQNEGVLKDKIVINAADNANGNVIKESILVWFAY